MTAQRIKVLGIALGLAALTAGGVAVSAHGPSVSRYGGGQTFVQSVQDAIGDGIGVETFPPGTIDDGKDLIPLATISLDDAIAAAKTAGSGIVGEVDLEYLNSTLVYNVDIGNLDVKVDATTGDVLGSGTY